jgi:hypothetical protein
LPQRQADPDKQGTNYTTAPPAQAGRAATSVDTHHQPGDARLRSVNDAPTDGLKNLHKYEEKPTIKDKIPSQIIRAIRTTTDLGFFKALVYKVLVNQLPLL